MDSDDDGVAVDSTNSNSKNSWEPKDHLDCKDLIQAFHVHCNADKQWAKEKEQERWCAVLNGTWREPECILGCTNTNNELSFLIKWKGTNEVDLVLSRIANQKCPQMVIKYYEDHVIWANHLPKAEQKKTG